MILGHHPQEQNYLNEIVEIETPNGQTVLQRTLLLRVYPERFQTYGCVHGYTPNSAGGPPQFRQVRSQRLGITWEVIAGPSESPISGIFRGDSGDQTQNNTPAWVFYLRKLET